MGLWKGPSIQSTLMIKYISINISSTVASPSSLLSKHRTSRLGKNLSVTLVSDFSFLDNGCHANVERFILSWVIINATAHVTQILGCLLRYSIHPCSRLRFIEHNLHCVSLCSIMKSSVTPCCPLLTNRDYYSSSSVSVSTHLVLSWAPPNPHTAQTFKVRIESHTGSCIDLAPSPETNVLSKLSRLWQHNGFIVCILSMLALCLWLCFIHIWRVHDI